MSEWIEHDGLRPSIPDGAWVRIRYLGPGITVGDGRETDLRSWPGFLWRWRLIRTGACRGELRRICLDPTYAPIIAYSVKRPRALQLLVDLAANPPAFAPEGVDA